MRKSFKTTWIIIFMILFPTMLMYLLIFQYPNLKNNPKVGRWYKVETKNMISSDGSRYHAFFKKGSENNVMIYFAGGGLSVNEQTANTNLYTKRLCATDKLTNKSINNGGIASYSEENPFKDWTIILLPYTTGDFHCGTRKFSYIDKNGQEKTLYHNGYINFTESMNEILKCKEIGNPDNVIVTGYSAGGFGAALLADNIFSNYFKDAKSKIVLIDSGMMLNDNWPNVITNIWNAPKHISEKATSNNITLDMLTELHKKYGDNITILYASSVRDGILSQIQSYLKNEVINKDTGKIPIKEEDVDEYQLSLKEFVLDAKEKTGAYFFIFDDYPDYKEHQNMTSHTIITNEMVFKELNNTDCSISKWLFNSIHGNPKDYGMELLYKEY